MKTRLMMLLFCPVSAMAAQGDPCSSKQIQQISRAWRQHPFSPPFLSSRWERSRFGEALKATRAGTAECHVVRDHSRQSRLYYIWDGPRRYFIFVTRSGQIRVQPG